MHDNQPPYAIFVQHSTNLNRQIMRAHEETDGGYTGLMWGPNAVGADAGTSSSIMGGMTNSSPTNYSTGPHPGGTFPDGAAGLQFHVTLPPGPTTICTPAYIGIGANGVIPPLEVPEPGSLALLGIGAAVALVRQRRRR